MRNCTSSYGMFLFFYLDRLGYNILFTLQTSNPGEFFFVPCAILKIAFCSVGLAFVDDENQPFPLPEC